MIFQQSQKIHFLIVNIHTGDILNYSQLENKSNIVSIDAGMTPLTKAENLGKTWS